VFSCDFFSMNELSDELCDFLSLPLWSHVTNTVDSHEHEIVIVDHESLDLVIY